MLRAARRSLPTVPPPPPGDLRSLYAWLDRLPLSRPKRHLARHFGDGVMMAKIVKYFHPQLVDLHNYVPTCNTDQKLSNWSTFNRKVFHKLCFCISEADICKVVANMPGAMEPILQDMAGWPWEAPDHGVQQLLEVKEQALAILQETVKILQMKVARLEQLVKLKDLRIRELAGHADKAQ